MRTEISRGSLLDLAGEINSAIEKMDISALEECLKKCDHIFGDAEDLEKIQLYCYRANIHSVVNNMKNKKAKKVNVDWISYKYDELLNLRKAMSHPKFNELPLTLRCQIKTNLGNCLSGCYRYVEAIEEYDAVIIMLPNFAMALSSRAICLKEYAALLYDKNHQRIIYLEAYKSIEKALDISAYWGADYDEGNITRFRKERIILKNKIEYIEYELKTLWPKRLSKKEMEYRKTCLWHKLFLNPLNDISNILPIAARDIFHLPDHIYGMTHNISLMPENKKMKLDREKLYIDWTETDLIYKLQRLDGNKQQGSINFKSLPKGFPLKRDLEKATIFLQDIILAVREKGHAKVTAPWFVEFFNVLKQEYITSRSLYVESLKEKKGHFIDKETYLPSIGEYIVYGIKYEKLKLAFRVAYSLFDKISEFLHNYFDIQSEGKIYSTNLWGNLTLEKKELYAQNRPLKALIHLIHDFFDQKDQENVEKSDRINLYDIRNAVEHRFLFIYDVERIKKLDKSIACKITVQDLEESTLKILKAVRATLIYLSLAVKIEEHRKATIKA